MRLLQALASVHTKFSLSPVGTKPLVRRSQKKSLPRPVPNDSRCSVSCTLRTPWLSSGDATALTSGFRLRGRERAMSRGMRQQASWEAVALKQANTRRQGEHATGQQERHMHELSLHSAPCCVAC